jgi:hypothetical protein
MRCDTSTHAINAKGPQLGKHRISCGRIESSSRILGKKYANERTYLKSFQGSGHHYTAFEICREDSAEKSRIFTKYGAGLNSPSQWISCRPLCCLWKIWPRLSVEGVIGLQLANKTVLARNNKSKRFSVATFEKCRTESAVKSCIYKIK